MAVTYYSELLVRNLLEYGASIEVKEKSTGTTPLLNTSSIGLNKIVQLLLDKGADMEAKNNNGFSALFLAVINKHEPVVRTLFEKGGNLQAQTETKSTPIHGAAERGHEMLVRFLLDRGASADTRDDKGFTPLLLASANGHETVVKVLSMSRDNGTT